MHHELYFSLLHLLVNKKVNNTFLLEANKHYKAFAMDSFGTRVCVARDVIYQ